MIALRHRAFARAYLPLILVLLPTVCHAERTRDYTAFLARLETAVNKGDTAALKTMSVPGATEDFTWVSKTPGVLGGTRPWRASLLELPGAEGPSAAFVAFSRYQLAESTGDHLYRVAALPDGPRLGEETPETETGGFRVRDHLLTVRFDVPRRRVRITDRVTVERSAPPSAGAGRQASLLSLPILRLNTIYTVAAVRRNGSAVPYRRAGGFLAVSWPASADRAVYDLAYESASMSSSEDFIKPTEAALTSYWYPHIARLPATHAVRITVPKGWTAIGQGEPMGKSVAGREVTYAWKNRLPVCYFTVAAGRYTVTTRRIGAIPVSAYLLRHSPSRVREAVESAGNALQWFSRNFAPYPYSRYAVVESDTFPPALECYSFTLVNRGLIPLAVPHEAAHTWWGGLVPNTYTRSLWNESFAEYSDGLYQRQTGRSGMHEFNAQRLGMAMGPLMSRVSLVEAKDAMDIAESTVGYGKGSMVLENLERLLGTPKMLAAIRRFIARHRPGDDAEWPHFIDAVEEVAGKEWRAFFPPWLTRTDLPDLRLRDVRAVREGNRHVVSGTVTQGDPVFWISIPLVVKTESGEIKRRVVMKSRETPFRIEAGAKPTQVALDPGRETLRAPIWES